MHEPKRDTPRDIEGDRSGPARSRPDGGEKALLVGGGFAAGLLSAAGWILAFPPFSLWPAVFLVVWPALRLAESTPRPCRAGLWFAAGTIPAWAWLTRWSAQGTVAGYPLLVLYLSLFSGLTVWALARARSFCGHAEKSDLQSNRSAPPGWLWMLVAPVVWVAVEFFRGRIAFHGFPWFLAGHPLIDTPALAWPARFIGAYAVSGLLVAGVLMLDRFARSPRRWIAPGVFFSLWLAGSWLPAPRASTSVVRMGVVQTDVPQSIKQGWSTEDRWQDWLTMRDLLEEAAEADPPPDVIMLPETMFPGFVFQDDAAGIERETGVAWSIGVDPASGRELVIRAETIRDQFFALQRAMGVPVLVGATRYEGFGITPEGDRMYYEHDRRFNSVFRVEGGRIGTETYDKQRLTPFGEVMPYISAWPWLERQLFAIAARGMRFDLDAGRARTVFELEADGGPVQVVTPICFEATIADACRSLVFERGKRRAGVLVNMTNDGWFYGARGGRELHMLAARWRCVELATPMVRVANTGVSASIDHLGAVTGSLEPHRAGVLLADVSPGSGVTIYARVGDVVAWISFLAAILGLGLTYTRFGRRYRTGPGLDDEVVSESSS